jgi:capsular polysaccharide biosynthesis protein
VSVRQGDAVAPERLEAEDFAVAGESQAADLIAGLASLRFMGTALRRRAWVWCATALAGTMIGLGLLAVVPPAFQASTSVLLTNDPTADPTDAIQTDLALAQTWAVAQGALQRLGLRQSVSSFRASYTVTMLSDRILVFAANAPSGSQAVSRANALAAEYLRFRAYALQIEQQTVLATLGQQIALTTRELKPITEQVNALAAIRPLSSAQLADLHSLQAQQYTVADALAELQHSAASYPVTTTAMTAGSVILDAAVLTGRAHQALLFYPVGGLFAGLMLGLGIVIVGALSSDSLRRRDDVARALGTPVSLSVGGVHSYRWVPGRLRLAAARGRDIRRIVACLRRAVPAGSADAALAAVCVDNARTAALPLVALALSYAREGKRVVVADLSGGAPAARLLGVRRPGVGEVRVRGVRLVVAVPGRDDVVPMGPLPAAASGARPWSATEALAAAYDSADLLLTLATLDPALGGEHLATWAADVITVVAAGRSSAAKIHAASEMIRLAGLPQPSAVLIGADKADVSLGVTWALSRSQPPAQVAGVSG